MVMEEMVLEGEGIECLAFLSWTSSFGSTGRAFWSLIVDMALLEHGLGVSIPYGIDDPVAAK